uniref:Uncharacterized protein n=1 Tax=viral metagenome TaxID=1070528 RepID=A0A6M3IKP5_9ZZZZ
MAFYADFGDVNKAMARMNSILRQRKMADYYHKLDLERMSEQEGMYRSRQERSHDYALDEQENKSRLAREEFMMKLFQEPEYINERYGYNEAKNRGDMATAEAHRARMRALEMGAARSINAMHGQGAITEDFVDFVGTYGTEPSTLTNITGAIKDAKGRPLAQQGLTTDRFKADTGRMEAETKEKDLNARMAGLIGTGRVSATGAPTTAAAGKTIDGNQARALFVRLCAKAGIPADVALEEARRLYK